MAMGSGTSSHHRCPLGVSGSVCKVVGSASNLSVSHVHVKLGPLGSLAAGMCAARSMGRSDESMDSEGRQDKCEIPILSSPFRLRKANSASTSPLSHCRIRNTLQHHVHAPSSIQQIVLLCCVRLGGRTGRRSDRLVGCQAVTDRPTQVRAETSWRCAEHSQ